MPMKKVGEFTDIYENHSRVYTWIQRSLHAGNFRGNQTMKPVALRAYGEFMFFYGQVNEKCETLGSRNHDKKSYYGLLDKVTKLEAKWRQLNYYISRHS